MSKSKEYDQALSKKFSAFNAILKELASLTPEQREAIIKAVSIFYEIDGWKGGGAL